MIFEIQIKSRFTDHTIKSSQLSFHIIPGIDHAFFDHRVTEPSRNKPKQAPGDGAEQRRAFTIWDKAKRRLADELAHAIQANWNQGQEDPNHPMDGAQLSPGEDE